MVVSGSYYVYNVVNWHLLISIFKCSPYKMLSTSNIILQNKHDQNISILIYYVIIIIYNIIGSLVDTTISYDAIINIIIIKFVFII